MKTRFGIKKRTRKRFALLIIVVLIALVFFLTSPDKVKNFIYTVSAPFQRILWQAGSGISGFFESRLGFRSFQEENEELRQKLQELEVKTARIFEIEKENVALREAMEVGLGKEFNLILAKISGKYTSGDSILINKGLKDGIAENDPVINQQKVLIGKIEKVYDNFSRVVLISDKSMVFDVEILQEKEDSFDNRTAGKTKEEEEFFSSPFSLLSLLICKSLDEEDKETSFTSVSAVAKGQGNFRLILDLIPREKEFQKGEIVFTTSRTGIFPEGLLVGYINEIKRSDVDPFQRAEIKSAFDVKKIENLFIILSR